MKDVRIDLGGELRCWNCGSKGFTEKRTLRSKACIGVGALLTKKKLKCQVCGEYNDTGGNAQPYNGPASRKFRKSYEAELAAAAKRPAPVTAALSPADEIRKLAELRDAGVLDDAEFQAQKAKLFG